MRPEVQIVEDPARACAALLVGAAQEGGDLVLAGGSTPRAAYGQFVDAVLAREVDLTDTTLWFGDERCVPPDDQRSNYRMVKEALLDRLEDAAQPHVHRIKGELGPAEGADAYEHELTDGGPPQLDLILLGIGADGHTASLFPDQPSLVERSRLAVGVERAGLEPHVPRVTLTLPALALARRIVFLIEGSSKADAVAAAFGPSAKPDPHVPSSMVAPLANEMTVLLDRAAAAKL